jgi:hypothetical protein
MGAIISARHPQLAHGSHLASHIWSIFPIQPSSGEEGQKLPDTSSINRRCRA